MHHPQPARQTRTSAAPACRTCRRPAPLRDPDPDPEPANSPLLRLTQNPAQWPARRRRAEDPRCCSCMPARPTARCRRTRHGGRRAAGTAGTPRCCSCKPAAAGARPDTRAAAPRTCRHGTEREGGPGQHGRGAHAKGIVHASCRHSTFTPIWPAVPTIPRTRSISACAGPQYLRCARGGARTPCKRGQ